MEKLNYKEMVNKINQAIRDQLCLEDNVVIDGATDIDELMSDPLDAFGIITGIESSLGVDTEDLKEPHTVQDIYDYVAGQLQIQDPAKLAANKKEQIGSDDINV